MKKLKSVTPDVRRTMYVLVNSPPPPTAQGGGVITMELKKTRESLWGKLGGDFLDIDDTINFEKIGTQDIILKNSEYEVLVGCFENGIALSMLDAKKNDVILENLKEAPDYKEGEK